METTTHDPIRKFSWRFMALVEASPRVWFVAVTSAIVTLCIVWQAASAVTREVLPGVLWPLVSAAFAFAFAAFVGRRALTVVGRLDTPDTPFPAYYLRLLRDEAAAPKPAPLETVTITVTAPQLEDPTSRTIHGTDHTQTRSPHVCCPHPRPTLEDDPIVAGVRAARRLTRRPGRHSD